MAAPAPAPAPAIQTRDTGGLTTAQKLGIAAAVTVFVIGLCLVVYIIRRKRRQQQPHAVVDDIELTASRATATAPPPPPPPPSPASSRRDSVDIDPATAPPPSSPAESSDSGDSMGTVIVHSGDASPLNLGAAATRVLDLNFESTSSGAASPTTVLNQDLDWESGSSGSSSNEFFVMIVPR